MNSDSIFKDLKKQRHSCCVIDQDTAGKGVGALPSKEQLASKGLEAKVDMATHGQRSWALMELGSWRDRSLNASVIDSENSAAYVKARQREARRAMLGIATDGESVSPASVPAVLPKERERDPSIMSDHATND